VDGAARREGREPEVPDQFLPIPDTPELTRGEARTAFARYNDAAADRMWWKPGLDPAKLTHALREPAGVISGGVDAYLAKIEDGERSLALARQAAEFLLWAQQQSMTACIHSLLSAEPPATTRFSPPGNICGKWRNWAASTRWCGTAG